MPRASLRNTVLLAVALAAANQAGAMAQGTSPPPAAQPQPQKPYKPIVVTIANAARDAGLDALRKDVGDIAKRKDRAALSARIAREFFWERDFGGNFDPKKPAVDNLTAALGLDSDDGGGWESLGGFAAESSVGVLPGRASVVCAPAAPQFDEAARDQMIEESQTDGIEWSYPRAAGLQVRAAPQSTAAVIETLGLHFVHVLGFEGPQTDADPMRISWARVATPSGKIGFIAPNSLVSPYTDRLCFMKDATGAWRIGGYVGGGD